MKATLDKAGRLVLPKPLRDALQLVPGDTFEIAVEGETVTMRPRRHAPPLEKERGVWVFRTGEPLTTEQARDVVHGIREHRARRNRGEPR